MQVGIRTNRGQATSSGDGQHNDNNTSERVAIGHDRLRSGRERAAVQKSLEQRKRLFLSPSEQRSKGRKVAD